MKLVIQSQHIPMLDRERHSLELLDPTVKGQLYMQTYKIKYIDKHTEMEPTIIFWDKTNKNITHK